MRGDGDHVLRALVFERFRSPLHGASSCDQVVQDQHGAVADIANHGRTAHFALAAMLLHKCAADGALQPIRQ